ncbi:MAG: ABC transporter substrate-binding protein [Bacilli bacterium]|nr:ABC transporter substrate-binding protein [Bacilli bacterium]
MIKKIPYLFAVMTLLSSCGGGTPLSDSTSKEPIKVTDMIGREVTIDVKGDYRVVCLGAGALRLYSYVGNLDLLCGVEDIDNPEKSFMWQSTSRPYFDAYKDKFKNLPSCGLGGPNAQAPEFEKILECRPNIIISEFEDVAIANDIQEKVGVPVVTLKYGKQTVFDPLVEQSIELLGTIFHTTDRSKALVSYIDAARTDLGNRTKDVKEEDKPSLYLGCLGNYGVQDIYMSCVNYPIFKASNIKNVLDDKGLNPGFQKMDKEFLTTLDADKIILDASGISVFKTTYEEDKEFFDNLKAFKNNEVYLQMPYNAYYTNLETALMDAYFDASVAYPKQFKDLDMENKYNEILETFVGKRCYDEVKAKPASYGGFQKIDFTTFFD